MDKKGEILVIKIPIPGIPGLYVEVDMKPVDDGYEAKATLYYLGINLGSEAHESVHPNAGPYSYMRRDFNGPIVSGFAELWIRWNDKKLVFIAEGREKFTNDSFHKEKWVDF